MAKIVNKSPNSFERTTDIKDRDSREPKSVTNLGKKQTVGSGLRSWGVPYSGVGGMGNERGY